MSDFEPRFKDTPFSSLRGLCLQSTITLYLYNFHFFSIDGLSDPNETREGDYEEGTKDDVIDSTGMIVSKSSKKGEV